MLDKSKRIENLCEFLTGEEERGLIEERHYEGSRYHKGRSVYTYFLKVRSGIDSVDLIYAVETESRGVIGIYSDMSFKGIYDNSKKVIYISDYYYIDEAASETVSKLEEIKGVRLSTISEMRGNFKDDFESAIIKKVGFDEKSIKDVSIAEDRMNDILTVEAPKEALEMFMNGRNKDNVDVYSYSKLNYLEDTQYSGDLMVRYLNNPEETLDNESNMFINEKKKLIFGEIIKTKQILKELEKLEKNEEMIERREVYSILKNNSRKSLNVDLIINDKDFSCRIETCGYGYSDGDLSEYNIIGNDKKEEYRGLVERGGSGYTPFSAVQEIKYRGKILYKKQ